MSLPSTVALNDLVKHYATPDGTPIRAVDGVSMELAAGEVVALYGPSGSGKSTLLRMVAALLQPDRGTIIVNGRNICALSADDAARYRRLELGYVRQEPDMVHGATAIDNAALKLLDTDIGRREARRRVTPLMETLGLQDRLRSRAETLSAGERQRVLIARALSTRPRLILADEPTGALDTERSAEVLALLTGLCRDHSVAMLLVTHDPQAAEYATRVHTLRDGRLHGDLAAPAPT